MKTTMNIMAVASLAAVASAGYSGYAQVINACSNTIYIQDVPAVNDLGIDTISKTLDTGDSYSRNWVALATGGFSIKMSPNDIGEYATDGIVQYEWNMNAPPTLWWDVSNVNDASNTTLPVWTPYSSDSSCTASFKSYVYPTDDTAMQSSCESTDVVMTILLCSDSDAASGLVSQYGLASGSTPSAPASSSAKSTPTSTSSIAELSSTSVYVAPTTTAEATSAPATTEEATTTTPVSTEESTSSVAATTYGHHGWNTPVQKEVVQATTLATSAIPVASPATTSAPDANVVWVTDVQTAYETQNVVQTVVIESDGTVSEKKHRRHAHGHPHGRKH